MVKPITATLFAYQVGFGDCFLLRFDYDDQTRRHVLIDFGTTGLPKDVESGQMVRVAKDITEKCQEPGGDGIDVLVATHRHADHISGFATRENGKGPGDIIAKLKPKLIIQPWTEAKDAPRDWLGPEESAPDDIVAMARHWQSLTAMEEASAQSLAFVEAHGRHIDPDVAGQLSFIGEGNLSNRSAVMNLQAMGEKTSQFFAYHGCDLPLEELLPDIDVTVMGPPTLRQTGTIRKQRSRDEDEFWQLQPKRLAKAVSSGSGKGLFPAASYKPATKLPTEMRWLAHRIDNINGELMLGIVRALDRKMNNTSLILHMKAGSKSLLFPGDAQIENWAYALQSPLAPLLNNVDLYKVGHHGSLNATPRSMWKRFSKKGKSDSPNRMTSVVSTRKGKHGSKEKHTEVPRSTLVKELEAATNYFSTEDIDESKLYKEIVMDLRS